TYGANYYYLGDEAHVQQVFDTDADLIITPVAYDLQLALSPAVGWKLARMYGIPGNAAGTPASGYTIATAFLSHRRGSIVARLEWQGGGAPPPTTGTMTLAYRPEAALGWTADENQAVDSTAGAPGSDGTYYDSDGVHKAVMLVNMAVQM